MAKYGGIADSEITPGPLERCWVCGVPVWGCTVYAHPVTVLRLEPAAMAEDVGLQGFLTDEPICADASHQVVACDDPRVAFQIAAAGTWVDGKTADRYGLTGPARTRAQAPPSEPEPAPEPDTEPKPDANEEAKPEPETEPAPDGEPAVADAPSDPPAPPPPTSSRQRGKAGPPADKALSR